ncbi:MAG: CpaD family pilus assembly protein [Sphingomicrobium sp.]|nr:CpaD family pilus assembly protein [Sphingomonadales bacterium]
MRHSLLILATAATLAGCGHVTTVTDTRRGLDPIHVPVVTRQDFVFDAAAPDGSLAPSEAARLDGWFQGMDLTYGDNVYVEGPYAAEARHDVARVAGRYGLLVMDGGPVLTGAVAPGAVRIVVSRTRASVPNCPDWSEPSQPNYNNHSVPSYGCGVNSNLAAMVANPEDLIHGREGNGVGDALTSTKAVESYRAMKPTGEGGLKDISTKKGGN